MNETIREYDMKYLEKLNICKYIYIIMINEKKKNIFKLKTFDITISTCIS